MTKSPGMWAEARLEVSADGTEADGRVVVLIRSPVDAMARLMKMKVTNG